jgi:hypothetical protein
LHRLEVNKDREKKQVTAGLLKKLRRGVFSIPQRG